MSRLDDRAFLSRLDPRNMLALTLGFPAQCREAVEIARKADLPKLEQRPGATVLTGLGGSAAGGDFVRAIFEESGVTPFLVNRDYHLPRFVGLGDLVLCASYSGNTEETLSAYRGALKAGSKVVAITSGGALSLAALSDGAAVIVVPGGQPPRTALGYMMMPALVACERFHLIPEQPYDAAIAAMETASEKWLPDVPTSDNPAKQIATAIHGTVPVFYGVGAAPGVVAGRWKAQLNENAKVLAFSNVLPELNHNEILGWEGAANQGVAKWTGVFLEDDTATPKLAARARFTQELIGEKAAFHTIRVQGKSSLERMLKLAFFGDFVSLYLAALNGVDPEMMDSIDLLKRKLSSVS